MSGVGLCGRFECGKSGGFSAGNELSREWAAVSVRGHHAFRALKSQALFMQALLVAAVIYGAAPMRITNNGDWPPSVCPYASQCAKYWDTEGAQLSAGPWGWGATSVPI